MSDGPVMLDVIGNRHGEDPIGMISIVVLLLIPFPHVFVGVT